MVHHAFFHKDQHRPGEPRVLQELRGAEPVRNADPVFELALYRDDQLVEVRLDQVARAEPRSRLERARQWQVQKLSVVAPLRLVPELLDLAEVFLFFSLDAEPDFLHDFERGFLG